MSNEDKKRGGCLTAYLVVMIILQVIGIVTIFFYDKLEQIPGVPPMDKTTLIISILLGVLALAGLIGTWLFKSWGVYAYAIAQVASIIVTAMEQFSAMNLAFGIGFLALFLYLTKDIWKNKTDENNNDSY